MSEEAMVVSGTRRQYKELVDGTLRVQIDIEPRFKQAFLRLFPGIDAPVAIAPLTMQASLSSARAAEEAAQKTAAEQKPSQPRRGQTLSQYAAMCCADFNFQRFLHKNYHAAWQSVSSREPSNKNAEDIAAKVLRKVLNIESRAELDNEDNVELIADFHNLRRSFNENPL